MGILADGFMDVELHLRAVLDGRVGVERDVGEVAHTVALDRSGGGGEFRKVSFEVFDHTG